MCGVFIHLIWYIIFDLHPVFYLTFPISLALGPCFGTYVCTLRLCVAFYHMHLFSLCLSNYFNIIVIERRRANDFQDGEKYKIWYVYNIALSIIIITIKDGQHNYKWYQHSQPSTVNELEYTSQVTRAVLFHMSANEDSVSHPARELNRGRVPAILNGLQP